MKVLVVVAMLLVAQIVPSCGSGPSSRQVIGTVEAKWISLEGWPMVTVDLVEYTVPIAFWNDINIGDLVKRTDTGWSVIRRSRR